MLYSIKWKIENEKWQIFTVYCHCGWGKYHDPQSQGLDVNALYLARLHRVRYDGLRFPYGMRLNPTP